MVGWSETAVTEPLSRVDILSAYPWGFSPRFSVNTNLHTD